MKTFCFLLFLAVSLIQVQSQTGMWTISASNSSCCNPQSPLKISSGAFQGSYMLDFTWENTAACTAAGSNIAGAASDCSTLPNQSPTVLPFTCGIGDLMSPTVYVSGDSATLAYGDAFGDEDLKYCNLTLTKFGSMMAIPSFIVGLLYVLIA